MGLKVCCKLRCGSCRDITYLVFSSRGNQPACWLWLTRQSFCTTTCMQSVEQQTCMALHAQPRLN